jgi:hypothetical protein
MSSEFLTYLRLGFAHIADLAGYDHILFVAALTGGYALGAWRRLLWLVTAFTLGHSVTLALATLRLVTLDGALVEVLIPGTILATALLALVQARRPEEARPWRRTGWRGADTGPPAGVLYLMAVCFGLVHGLGFSTYLRALLGAESSLLVPLLGFNVGLELGQLLIVAATMLVGALFVRLGGFARRDWTLVLAGATGGLALVLLLQRLAALRGGAGVA